MMATETLIYDWNTAEQPRKLPRVELFDETLRDGLQSPSVTDPPLEEKFTLLRLMDRLHIDAANIGLPGAGKRAYEDTLALARFVAAEKLNIKLVVAARTMVRDIEPVVDIVQKSGVPIDLYAFIGSSPIRFYAEGWTTASVRTHIREAVTYATQNNLRTCLVTEDTTRAAPDVLTELFNEGLSAGANALCLCDTVGHATPDGTRALVRFAKTVIEKFGAPKTRLDWHGHNDRGLGVINALAAHQAGVQRIHGSALGVGERVGNAAMDQIIVNLMLSGDITHDISALAEYVNRAAAALGLVVPINYPALGRDAFRTSTGVHAAAIIKAMKKNDRDLADRVYSAVPASALGRRQEIEIGPMSGLSNVQFWLDMHAVPANEKLALSILELAKKSDHSLADAELWAVVKAS